MLRYRGVWGRTRQPGGHGGPRASFDRMRRFIQLAKLRLRRPTRSPALSSHSSCSGGRRFASSRGGTTRPRIQAPNRSAAVRHRSAATSTRCTWRYACRKPSRARYASAATLFGARPSSGANSTGVFPSTSVCHRIICQRCANRAKARAASDRSRNRTLQPH